MKKKTKFAFAGLAFTFVALAATSCTSNFCSNKEKSRILFAIEPGVSTYYASLEECNNAKKGEDYTYYIEQVFPGNPNLWRSVEVSPKQQYTKSNQLAAINSAAHSGGYVVPTPEFYARLDTKVLEMANNAHNSNLSLENQFDTATITKENAESVLVEYGYLKYYGTDDSLWGNYNNLVGVIATEIGVDHVPNADYMRYYKSTLESAISANKSCIATVGDNYGAYGQDKISVYIDAKDWGYAWSKGLIEGLIVYPVAWLVDTFTNLFAGGTSADKLAAGWPQLLALIVVTVIVRLVIIAVTFKSTASQQKIQALQPELAKIQAKYPNSNTNQAEKQRLAEEQMKLYKKHKINPLSQLLIMFIQFPIFIGVWGAMTGSAVLSSGSFLNLRLSSSILEALQNFSALPSNDTGWWTALVLFILMSVAQFLSMKIPQWIAKARTKKVARLGVNPAQNQQNKTMNIVSYVMLIMIVFMGFTLPAAMGVYWLIGALISLAQSLITQAILNRKKHNK